MKDRVVGIYNLDYKELAFGISQTSLYILFGDTFFYTTIKLNPKIYELRFKTIENNIYIDDKMTNTKPLFDFVKTQMIKDDV